MPFVIVEMWEGRTVAQKRRLVRAITDAMMTYADVKPDHLHVVIHDTPKEKWGRAGILERRGAGGTCRPGRRQADESLWLWPYAVDG